MDSVSGYILILIPVAVAACPAGDAHFIVARGHSIVQSIRLANYLILDCDVVTGHHLSTGLDYIGDFVWCGGDLINELMNE